MCTLNLVAEPEKKNQATEYLKMMGLFSVGLSFFWTNHEEYESNHYFQQLQNSKAWQDDCLTALTA